MPNSVTTVCISVSAYVKWKLNMLKTAGLCEEQEAGGGFSIGSVVLWKHLGITASSPGPGMDATHLCTLKSPALLANTIDVATPTFISLRCTGQGIAAGSAPSLHSSSPLTLSPPQLPLGIHRPISAIKHHRTAPSPVDNRRQSRGHAHRVPAACGRSLPASLGRPPRPSRQR